MIRQKTMIAIMLALVLLLAACSGGGNNDANSNGGSSTPAATTGDTAGNSAQKADTPEQSLEKIELRMSWWGSQERHDKTLAAIELFEKQNPGVTITGEYSGFDGYMDKL